MSYGAAVRVFANPVDTMFGLVPVKKVMQAVREAREEGNRERIADLTSGPFRDRTIALAKRAGEKAAQASRPIVAPNVVIPNSVDNV